MPYKTIKLSRLTINPENDRFESVIDEKEAIDVMLTKLGSKIYRIAQHILNNGLSPKPFYVISSGNKYIVKEGNRRTTALKLMARPSLINEKKFAQLKKGFLKLNSKYKTSPINAIHCYVYDSSKEADKWVKLEHTGEQLGLGVVDWNPEQIRRFDIKHGRFPTLEIQSIDFLKQSVFVEDVVISLLNEISVTNLQRLISNPKVREKLGIDLRNGVLVSEVEEYEVVIGLSSVIKRIAQPSFKVKDIYTAKLAEDYIDAIPIEELPDLNKKVDPWILAEPIINAPEDPTPIDIDKKPKKRNISPKQSKRKTLIPKSCVMNIVNPKVNKIYDELQNIDVTRFTNCVAVTLRVFIELSVDTYIENNELVSSDKISASKSGMNLFQKVSKVCDHLSKLRQIDDNLSKGIKIITKDQNSIWGIDTIQAYVHNNQLSPIADHVITTWDNIQEFMITLWNNIEIKE